MNTGITDIHAPIQQPKPFWKSKGFWGGVLATVAPIIPGVGPIIGVAAGVLSVYGRAAAQGPLTLTGPTAPYREYK